MRVLLFGASGMVGQGVLRECILDPGVTSILSIVRSPSTVPQDPKVREIVTGNFYDFQSIQPDLAGCDACFFSLGVSSFGMKEADFRRITYDITLAAANALLQASPASIFIYVSGAGTDPNGRAMWARVKGATENALLAMPFRAAYMFRPGAIIPLHGVRSKTALYRVLYTALAPLLPILLRTFPNQVTTTEQVGRAMLSVARRGYPRPILEPADIANA